MMMFENRAYHFLVVESRQHDRQHAFFSAFSAASHHHRAAAAARDDDDDAFARLPFSSSLPSKRKSGWFLRRALFEKDFPSFLWLFFF